MRWAAVVLLGLALAGCRKAAPPPAPAPVAVAPAAPSGDTAEELEVQYLATNDLRTKLEIISDLTDMPPAVAVEVLGRMFYYEEDTEIREEMLHSLMDVEGQPDAKRKLLEEAIQPDMPLPLRLAAIDLLAELGDKRALPALQRLLADPQRQVRDALADALNDLM